MQNTGIRNTMTKRSRKYIWQFTIGLGFLSGLWSAIGIDPQDVILNLLGIVTGEIYPDPLLRQLFVILPLLLLFMSVRGAYMRGKIPGLVSVLIAYGAGLSILVALWTALILLAVAIVTGYIATSRRRF